MIAIMRPKKPANAHTPQFVNEGQSALRGIDGGWYAMDGEGRYAFGPFLNRENCLSRIFQFATWSRSSALRHRPV